MSQVFSFVSGWISSPVVSAIVGALAATYIVGRIYGGRPVRDGIFAICKLVGISEKRSPSFDEEEEVVLRREPGGKIEEIRRGRGSISK